MRSVGAGRVVVGVLALALAGCTGGSGGPAGTSAPAAVTTTVTVTASSTPASPDDGPGPAQGGTVDPDDPQGVAQAYGVTLVDPQAAGMVEYGFIGFRSPSGRIICGMSDEDGGTPAYARCDVLDNVWTPPAKPADCDLDWGSSVGVVADGRRARFNCVGDVASDGPAVLGYGKGVLAGPVLCVSRTTGVECVVTSGPKHGFRVARAAYSLY